MKMAEVPYYQSHAHALYANRKERVALLYFEMAIEDTGEPVTDIATIEFYAELLLANCKTDRAYRLLLNTAKTGRSTKGMNDQLKALHKWRTGSDQSITQLLDSIQNNLSLSYIAEAKSTMIVDEKAPAFELEDLHGKNVSLSQFKNRVVVLDFWATWCAPCIASMPAMGSLRRKHPEVAFLFISTGESGK
ncbi:MAG: TlpA family protein disulfide reductase, partial [Chitinophagaceae bacterium]